LGRQTCWRVRDRAKEIAEKTSKMFIRHDGNGNDTSSRQARKPPEGEQGLGLQKEKPNQGKGGDTPAPSAAGAGRLVKREKRGDVLWLAGVCLSEKRRRRRRHLRVPYHSGKQ